MKSLLPSFLSVLFSTVGTAYGCHAVGMPLHEVKLATALAFVVSFAAAFGAVWLAARSRQIHRNPTR